MDDEQQNELQLRPRVLGGATRDLRKGTLCCRVSRQRPKQILVSRYCQQMTILDTHKYVVAGYKISVTTGWHRKILGSGLYNRMTHFLQNAEECSCGNMLRCCRKAFRKFLVLFCAAHSQSLSHRQSDATKVSSFDKGQRITHPIVLTLSHAYLIYHLDSDALLVSAFGELVVPEPGAMRGQTSAMFFLGRKS